MSHKTKYKLGAPSIQDMRTKQRQSQIEIRKNKRERRFNAKRVRLEDEEKEKPEISVDETEAVCRELVKKGSHDLEESLKTLRRALAQGPEFIDTIFKVDNCLQSLVGVLTGSDTDLQSQAAWCLTNIATGGKNHTLAVAKAAAPYFITYLTGSNTMLQDQCAWALGNIAGDSAECCKILQLQGCIPPLVKLLESPVPSCIQSAAFALANLIRDVSENSKEAVNHGILPLLLKLLQTKDISTDLLCEVAWVLTYLTHSDDIAVQMVSMGFLSTIVNIIVHCTVTDQIQEGQVVTPMLRALGNICSGPDDFSLTACENPRLMPALLELLKAPLPHIARETLWVLSNMTSDYSIVLSVVYGPLLQEILAQLDKNIEFQEEALYVLCNMATHGETVSGQLVAHGAVAKVVPLLKIFDLEVLHLALAFCEMTIRYSDEAKFIFEECGGLSHLEQLQNHPNSQIQEEAEEIIDTYFGKDYSEEVYD
ncbi:hypothetical protein C0Q70_06820 [Pomacea canaliculata]|uniref:Importin subunit alpha n=1 Tax=Pomacea canaliculata TaxID=400727 RepID=A0A2T7PDB9_POMCA|nr:importin subunit alpha-6-like [Pomacea canaliculata]PVD31408.1 hypothetical protein C0Q70_06820 [Pomacea canaliculata]